VWSVVCASQLGSYSSPTPARVPTRARGLDPHSGCGLVGRWRAVHKLADTWEVDQVLPSMTKRWRGGRIV
jgi:hypothetical protein